MFDKKVMIFDFDGTLADSFQHTLESFFLLANKYDKKVLKEHKNDDFLSYRNYPSSEIIKMFKISKLKLVPIVWLWRREVKKTVGTIPLFKDIPEVLHALKSHGWTLGLATSNSKVAMKKYFSANNLDVFDFVYGDISLFGKSRAFKKIIKEQHLTPSFVYYVGDQPRDVEAAKSVGFVDVAVDWGFSTHELLVKYNPTYLISTPTELLTLN